MQLMHFALKQIYCVVSQPQVQLEYRLLMNPYTLEVNLLAPLRTVGMITGEIPCALTTLGKENFVVLGLDHTFQVMKASRLETSLVAPQIAGSIRALTTKGMLTFTAVGADVIIWDSSRKVRVLSGHANNIDMLLVLGNHLLSLSRADRCLKIWEVTTGLQVGEDIIFPINFVPTAWAHPSTYLNKIVIGSEDGRLHIWNMRTRKLIFECSFELRSIITCIEQSPAVDVIALGTQDGRILLHNIRFDRSLMIFQHSEGSVASLSFRTDPGSDRLPLLASGCSSGRVIFWNLAEKKLHSQIDAAHDANVTKVCFLPGQGILLTTGLDNAIRQWALDRVDGSARLLRCRMGHQAPPTHIRYYGDGRCCQILSGGDDCSFRVFHTARQEQSTELSQGKLLSKARQLKVSVESLKLPPIINFASSETRSRQWANIITCHRDHPTAHVWSFDKRSIGKHILTPPKAAGVPICCTISVCGHVGLLGTAGGVVIQFNLQSGQQRGQYGGQEGARGIGVGGLGLTLVTCGIDGTVRFWNYSTRQQLTCINLPDNVSASQLVVFRNSGLVAVASDDHIIRIFDVSSHKLVRRFCGHKSRITDITFSNDGRWLVSACAAGDLRVWDLMTARCIDWVRFKEAITSLTFSPTGEYLATSHVGHVGISLWANRNHFDDILLDAAPSSPIEIDLPMPKSENKKQYNDDSDDDSENEEDDGVPTPLKNGLVTLSSIPRNRWATLPQLDIIIERNKPKEAPKVPEKAPFFLPTTISTTAETASDDTPVSKVLNDKASGKLNRSKPKLVQLLTGTTYDCNAVLKYLQSLTPSAVHVALSFLCMGPEDYSGILALKAFLDCAVELVQNRQCFQTVQAYINVFVKMHADAIQAHASLQSRVDILKNVERKSWLHLQEMMRSNLCLLKFFAEIR
eukprot:GSMAST32.ASY1.ANO1.637.1 assembled CDS